MRAKNSEIDAIVRVLELPHESPEEKARAIMDAALRELLERDSLHVVLYPNPELGMIFGSGPYSTRGDAQRAARKHGFAHMMEPKIIRLFPDRVVTEVPDQTHCEKCGHGSFVHGSFVKKKGCGVRGCQCRITDIPGYRARARR